MRKEIKKPGSRTSAEDRYRTATETCTEYDSYRFVTVCFAGQRLTQRMHVQAVSSLWWTDPGVGVTWRRNTPGRGQKM